VAYSGADPVGFACLVKSTLADDVGYLKRAGVMPAARGQGLQRKLISVREAQARRNGWSQMITDTTFSNVQSSNNLIRSGYHLFEPGFRWGFNTGLYWVKDL
jgi:GNAT superfamily N-acetyltransferase